MGKDDEAVQDADQSIELNASTFKVYRTRARAHLHLEKYEEAVKDFKTAVEYADSEGSDADVRALRTELKKAEVDLKRSKTKDYYKILGMSLDHIATADSSLTSLLLVRCTERVNRDRYQKGVPERVA